MTTALQSHPTLSGLPVLAVLSRSAQPLQAQLARHLEQVFPQVTLIAPNSVEAMQATIRARQAEFPLVLAVGGDGTLNRVLNAIDPSRQALGILPHGTGNDFARFTSFPAQLEARVSYLRTLELKPTDFAIAGDYRYINSGGFGLDSATLKLRVEKPSAWTRNYTFAFLQVLSTLRCPELSISTAGQTYAGRFYWVLAMNNIHIGGGTRIAPRASIDDGLLDLVLIREVSKLRMAMLVPQAVKGAHLRLDCVEYALVAEVCCTAVQPIEALALDGELYPWGNAELTFRAVPGGIRFLR